MATRKPAAKKKPARGGKAKPRAKAAPKRTKHPITPRVKTKAPVPTPTAEERKVALAVFVPPPPKPRSRREIVEAVCRHVVAGDRVHAACAKESIVWNQLWEWKLEDADLQVLYARAREASAESWEDKSTKHVEDATVDTVQLAHLREGNAKWRAKMANPKKFGDKIDLTSAGERLGLEELVAGSMTRTPHR